MRGLATAALGLLTAAVCKQIERRTKTMPTPGDREIDHVLEANQSPALRMLHAGYGDVLTMLSVTAREFETCGLTEQARDLRERKAQLDAEFAKAMRVRAARAT
jgi:hypothetical protein